MSGDLPAAIDSFNRALVIDPQDIDTLLNLAAAFDKSHDLSGTIECYNRVLAIDPQHVYARKYLDIALQLSESCTVK